MTTFQPIHLPTIESVTFSTALASVYPPVCQISFFHLTLPSISIVPVYAVPSHGFSLLCIPPLALQSRSLSVSPSSSLLLLASLRLAGDEETVPTILANPVIS